MPKSSTHQLDLESTFNPKWTVQLATGYELN
jgi:hypothetical protein